MGFMSPSTNIPEAPNPAKRPERSDTIEPEDIAVGGEGEESEKKGRRALRRPSGNTVGSNQPLGTGLSA